jgi:hypothetical protein
MACISSSPSLLVKFQVSTLSLSRFGHLFELGILFLLGRWGHDNFWMNRNLTDNYRQGTSVVLVGESLVPLPKLTAYLPNVSDIWIPEFPTIADVATKYQRRQFSRTL